MRHIADAGYEIHAANKRWQRQSTCFIVSEWRVIGMGEALKLRVADTDRVFSVLVKRQQKSSRIFFIPFWRIRLRTAGIVRCLP